MYVSTQFEYALTSVDGEKAFGGEVEVVVPRNIRRGGLHNAHLWIMGCSAEPVSLGVSASMVEFRIATDL